MQSVKKNNITLTRGDTFRAKIVVRQGDDIYEVGENDVLKFAVKERFDDNEEVKLLKIIPNNTCILHLEPSDTKQLLMDHTYIYQVDLTKENGDVDTFIEGRLKITGEVD